MIHVYKCHEVATSPSSAIMHKKCQSEMEGTFDLTKLLNSQLAKPLRV